MRSTVKEKLYVRILDNNDSEAYREMRLKGLLESRDAFSEAYEDVRRTPLKWFANFLEAIKVSASANQLSKQ